MSQRQNYLSGAPTIGRSVSFFRFLSRFRGIVFRRPVSFFETVRHVLETLLHKVNGGNFEANSYDFEST